MKIQHTTYTRKERDGTERPVTIDFFFPFLSKQKISEKIQGMFSFGRKCQSDGDTVTVRKMLSTVGVQSLINYQDSSGDTKKQCEDVRHLLATHCNRDSDLQEMGGFTVIQTDQGRC